MADRARVRPYSGYEFRIDPPEDAELTHVRAGTPCGEYLRRFWQPIAMSSEIGTSPVLVRVFGEDLVVFRDGAKNIGVMHKHCCHRRASLEFGKVEARGLRCCYHGWLFAHDGTVLETPGESPESRVKDRVTQPAYPARECNGLVFAYLGPPDGIPEFPIFDTFVMEDAETVNYSVPYHCNWLQIMDNSMDPVHSTFLHCTISGPQFSDIFGSVPVVDYHERPLGFFYTNARRVGDHIWVRTHDNISPNMAQSGAVTSLKGDQPRLFGRAGFSRWIVPIDDTHSKVMGMRYFGPHIDPKTVQDVQPESFEMLETGGTRNRSYSEMQRNPSDFEALESQGPIVVHAREHFASSDVGVAMRRERLRRAIRALRDEGQAPYQPSALAVNGRIPSYAGDTVLRAPKRNENDRGFILEISRKIAAAYKDAEALPDAERRKVLEKRLAAIVQ